MTLPTFIIAGVKKAATTSLYEYMKQHPQIAVSSIKETKYFLYDPANTAHIQASHNVFAIRSLDEYTKLFAQANGAKAVGEASPGYIENKQAAERICTLIPQVKLIFSLRNPVERAYSGYLMGVRGGYESRPFIQVLHEDRARLQAKSYYPLLTYWYDLFPAEQIKVLLFEEFIRRPVPVMQNLYRFVGADEQFVPDTSMQHNVGGLPKHQWLQSVLRFMRKYRYLRIYVPKRLCAYYTGLAKSNLASAPPMPGEAKTILTDLYYDDVMKLQELLQLDLSGWGFSTNLKY